MYRDFFGHTLLKKVEEEKKAKELGRYYKMIDQNERITERQTYYSQNRLNKTPSVTTKQCCAKHHYNTLQVHKKNELEVSYFHGQTHLL